MSATIPAQFTGQAALKKQDPKNFDLHETKYTPRPFTEEDVIIKIDACGVCGTDLHVMTCGWGEHDQFPAITGHEIVGHVVRAGKNTKHAVGDRVGVGAQGASCGECVNCLNHEEPYCIKGWVGTYQGPTGDAVQPYTQGGYADYYQGPGHFAVKIPEGIPSEVAAPLLCAGVTVYAPLSYYGAKAGKKVGIVGIGGLGHLGVQFGKALGAEVYAISHSDRKRADAATLGATGFINTHDGADKVLAEHAASFDIILSTSDQDDMPLSELYLPLLKARGQFISVGLPNDGLPRMGWSLLGKTVTGSLIGSPKEIEDMFKLAVEQNIRPWIETRPMSEATQTVNDMYAGKAKFRYVLVN